MLCNLHISNIALIDELDIDFTDGLNILTGETGAGKSIIVGSIGIGLGGRFDASLLRDAEKDGIVELLFYADADTQEELKSLGVDGLEEDGSVLISRRLSGGRTINRINDRAVTVTGLKSVAECLINLHAQHEQRTLLKAETQLKLIDDSDDRLTSLKDEVKELYSRHKEAADKLEAMRVDGAERLKRLDFISFEIKEIEDARLLPGEDETLESDFKRGSNAKDIVELTNEIHSLTGYDSDKSAGSLLSRAVRSIQSLTKLDASSVELVDMLNDIDSLLGDFNNQLSEYMSDSEFNDDELSEIERRLNLINGLKAKYGRTIPEIEDTLSSLKKEQEELLGYDEKLDELKALKDNLEKEMNAAADKLSKVRKKAADKLCRDISEAMESLAFNQVDLTMKLERLDSVTASGQDKAVFYLSTNVGEKPKPLGDVASGGELSRVLLAIKSTISEKGGTPTLIFDEIDAGISGITAQKVGRMMKRLSKTHQIISITHLPQIAAEADTAFVIEKSVIGDKTITGIRRLDSEGRVAELARLLGGENVTESVLSAAREMLDNNK